MIDDDTAVNGHVRRQCKPVGICHREKLAPKVPFQWMVMVSPTTAATSRYLLVLASTTVTEPTPLELKKAGKPQGMSIASAPYVEKLC